jgi:hypothetical protein
MIPSLFDNYGLMTVVNPSKIEAKQTIRLTNKKAPIYEASNNL